MNQYQGQSYMESYTDEEFNKYWGDLDHEPELIDEFFGEEDDE